MLLWTIALNDNRLCQKDTFACQSDITNYVHYIYAVSNTIGIGFQWTRKYAHSITFAWVNTKWKYQPMSNEFALNWCTLLTFGFSFFSFSHWIWIIRCNWTVCSPYSNVIDNFSNLQCLLYCSRIFPLSKLLMYFYGYFSWKINHKLN